MQNPQPRINCESWTFERGPGEVFATEIEGMWRDYLIFLMDFFSFFCCFTSKQFFSRDSYVTYLSGMSSEVFANF